MLSHHIEKLSVPELIESALQLDVGMYQYLPKEWQNPGVAGLCAFRLLADALHSNESSLTAEVKTLLNKIDEVSHSAIAVLEKDKTKAFIKSDMNKLFEYAEGFKREVYSEEAYQPIAKALDEAKLSTEGQLVFRKKDGRFFVVIHPDYIETVQKVYGKRDYPTAEMKQPHFTVNDGMKDAESHKIFQKLLEKYSECKNSLFEVKAPDVTVLNKKINFTVIGAYIGIPKTNSRFAKSRQLHIQSDDLDTLAKEEGLFSPLKDFWPHITFAEERRKPHPILTKEFGMVYKTLGKNELSQKLSAIITAGLSDTFDTTDKFDKFGIFAPKLHSSTADRTAISEPVKLVL